MIPNSNLVTLTDPLTGKQAQMYETIYGTSICGYTDLFGNPTYEVVPPANMTATKVVNTAAIVESKMQHNHFVG